LRRSGLQFSKDPEFSTHESVSPVKSIWRSRKTTDVERAIRIGRRLLFHLEQRVELGLPPKSKLFSVVIDDYVRFRERDHAHGRTSDGMLRQIIRVAKFWRQYAGAIPVEAIDDKMMRDFIHGDVTIIRISRYACFGYQPSPNCYWLFAGPTGPISDRLFALE
jgi:hypothetical protein